MNPIETCEYVSIVKRAGREGWLDHLFAAHSMPCTVEQATLILGQLRDLPKLKVIFRSKARGRARFSRRRKTYGMTLSSQPGGRCGFLRAGLVLHEAAHILAHLKLAKFDHQETYCRILRRLLQTEWRRSMPTSSFAAIYNRHRGPFTISLIREIDHGGKRGKEQVSDRIYRPLRESDEGRLRARQFNAEDAHEEARMLVSDPRENVTSAYVFSESEGQFIGAAYHRGETYLRWAEAQIPVADLTAEQIVDEVTSHPRLDPKEIVLSQRDQETLVDAIEHPAPPTEALKEAAERTDWKKIGTEAVPVKPKVPRRPSVALVVAPGSEERWPAAPSAQHILATFKARGAMTAKEAAEALATKLAELGVAHPASAVSRLRQAGLLQEVAA